MIASHLRATALILAAALLGTAAPTPAPAQLTAAQRSVLDRYLSALEQGRYDRAFALLTSSEQRYFGTPANFASGFKADGIKIFSYHPVKVAPFSGGVVVTVFEQMQFDDHAHAQPIPSKARVLYGLISEGGGVRVKDPYHPWLAVIPKTTAVTQDGLRVNVRKVSFFTGRVEVMLTFANVGDTTVTLLPYGRSVLRDDGGKTYHPIETTLPGLTDRNLRLGLRLPSDAQYTGSLTFLTPDRFAPKGLTLTVAPELRDGADAPFEVELPIDLTP